MRAFCFHCLTAIGLLRYPFKKRWDLLNRDLRPDEGQSLTSQNVGVPFGFVFCL